MRLFHLSLLYVVGFFIFSILSFSLTDPNLVISNNELYWNFQQSMWRNLFDKPHFQAQIFIFLFAYLATFYLLLIVNKIEITKLYKTKYYVLASFLLLSLVISYNALSHDVFNYMFNAKMVVTYSLDPHNHVALDVSHDDWLRFMHNTHTPAPYGYGWTLLSLIPFIFGFNTFILTFLSFKLWSLLSYLILVAFTLILKSRNALVVLLHPLVLIEVISSAHNDLYMMVPALISVWILAKKSTWQKILLASVLLALSISIKLATIVLVPLALLLFLQYNTKYFKNYIARFNLDTYWPLYASVLLFIPLLTTRSQQFHPWYFIWPFVWIIFFPRVKNVYYSIWQSSLIVLGIASLFRYIPWIYAGGFPTHVITQQKMITWIPFVICLSLLIIKAIVKKQTHEK